MDRRWIRARSRPCSSPGADAGRGAARTIAARRCEPCVGSRTSPGLHPIARRHGGPQTRGPTCGSRLPVSARPTRAPSWARVCGCLAPAHARRGLARQLGPQGSLDWLPARAQTPRPNSPSANFGTIWTPADGQARMRGKPELDEPAEGDAATGIGGWEVATSSPAAPPAQAAAWFPCSGLRPGFNPCCG